MRELIDPVAREIKPPLAFRLEVGLEESIDQLWEHDLDNYLFPNHKLGIRVGLPWAALVRGVRVRIS